jgi:adenylate cyclase
MVDRLIDRHAGRIANTAGDSVLAKFGSAPEAVACALAIQQANNDVNANIPDDRRMLLRIGVHLDEVMAQGGDL